jgi:HAD superfamily hydrolase (TIGR01549 family)
MIKAIFWDFDGVILDSMSVRDDGFRAIFREYPEELVERFIQYHRSNGGLSRFHKIRYFYETFLHQEIAASAIDRYAAVFSEVMRAELAQPRYLIDQTIEFIDKSHRNFAFHIVSGSEQNELRYLCDELGIAHYFKSINGSPTHKNDLVEKLLLSHSYKAEECLLIGDSINDYEAASLHGVGFRGFNNHALRDFGGYIEDFKCFDPMAATTRGCT